MRPVERGPWPVRNGHLHRFSRYQQARPFLIQRIGRYCSYCECRIEHMPAVEHVSPKISDPARERDWTNFLIACVNCNSKKIDKPTAGLDFFFPDSHNTFFAFTYKADGKVYLHPQLTDALDEVKARNTIDLVGLDVNSTDADTRQINRKDFWREAMKALARMSARPEDRDLRDQLKVGVERGHFSVWMTVFSENPTQAMRREMLLVRDELYLSRGSVPDIPENPWANTDLLRELRLWLLSLYPGTCPKCLDSSSASFHACLEKPL
jgi:uncharacterized protein (TIGR02646 family)